MSLRDQLLKAGLVTEEQVKKVESGTRKNKHKAKKDRSHGRAEAAKKAEQEKQRQQQVVVKREQDRKLNNAKEEERRRKANRSQVKQMIIEHRVNDAQAELYFNFGDGKYIRSVRVTQKQQQMLAVGSLGVARNPSDVFDFPLVPRATALKLTELDETAVIFLNPEGGAGGSDDDWADWGASWDDAENTTSDGNAADNEQSGQ